MVRFVTTAYTHMYDNSYTGQPGRKYRGDGYKGKPSPKLCPVGFRVEKWRGQAGVGQLELAEAAGVSLESYDRFIRGKQAMSYDELTAMANLLGISVENMTDYAPWEVPKQKNPDTSKNPNRPSSARSKKGTRTRKPKPYNADEAARLLAKRFGDRVKRV